MPPAGCWPVAGSGVGHKALDQPFAVQGDPGVAAVAQPVPEALAGLIVAIRTAVGGAEVAAVELQQPGKQFVGHEVLSPAEGQDVQGLGDHVVLHQPAYPGDLAGRIAQAFQQLAGPPGTQFGVAVEHTLPAPLCQGLAAVMQQQGQPQVLFQGLALVQTVQGVVPDVALRMAFLGVLGLVQVAQFREMVVHEAGPGQDGQAEGGPGAGEHQAQEAPEFLGGHGGPGGAG